MLKLWIAVAVALASVGCVDGDEPQTPDAAVTEPDAFLVHCGDCGGGICQPGDGWRCANAQTVFVACDNSPNVCE